MQVSLGPSPPAICLSVQCPGWAIGPCAPFPKGWQFMASCLRLPPPRAQSAAHSTPAHWDRFLNTFTSSNRDQCRNFKESWGCACSRTRSTIAISAQLYTSAGNLYWSRDPGRSTDVETITLLSALLHGLASSRGYLLSYYHIVTLCFAA